MIRWIQNRPWQSSTYFALFAFFLFGGADAIASGVTSLAVSITFSIAVLLARHFGWLSLLLILTGCVLAASLSVRFGFSFGIVLAVLVLLAAFGNRLQGILALPVSVLASAGLFWATIYSSQNGLAAYDIVPGTSLGELNIFFFGILSIISSCTLAWFAGRLLITRALHVGTSADKAVVKRVQARQELEIAEQNKRFEIARDISELIIQRISASISLAEGGVYATQTDPSNAPRIFEKVAESARSAHQELRRLFDLLNKKHEITSAPPRIDDLMPLVISYRQVGYNMSLRHEGLRYEMDEGAELAIYRIVFDALENVRRHAPIGTDVTIDFAWTDVGLQVLIKDNGVEVLSRGLSLEQLAYTIEEDRKSLVETISGADLTAMAERAALYSGTIEATRVPGVGFTVSAIFPDLKNIAKA